MNIFRRKSCGPASFWKNLCLCWLYIVTTRDRKVPKETPRNIKTKVTYCPLSEALQYKWTELSKRQTKEVNPALFFGILGTVSRLYSRFWFFLIIVALWQFSSSHQELPMDPVSVAEIHSIANSLISAADVNKQALIEVPVDLIT